MESVSPVSSPSVEVSLRSAGTEGLTIQELMDATDKPETTVRRLVGTYCDEGQAWRKPTFEGQKVIWGAKPADPNEPKVNPRRREAAERDGRVLEAIQVNGRISLNELAHILDTPDIHTDGWSQLTYLSLRRLQRRGLVEREIVWVHQGDPSRSTGTD